MSSRSTGSRRDSIAPASLRARASRSSIRPLQPGDLVELAPPRRRRVGSVRVALVDLELGPHPGQRCPQLVRRVGDEALLAHHRVLEAGEHVVHGLGEARDLVPGVGDGHPPIELGHPDRRDARPDLVDRPERAPDDDPHHDDQEHDDRGHRGRERVAQLGDAFVHVVGRTGDVDDTVVVSVGVVPLDDDAVRLVVVLHLVRVAGRPDERGRLVGVLHARPRDHVAVGAEHDDEAIVVVDLRERALFGLIGDPVGLDLQALVELIGEIGVLTLHEQDAGDAEHHRHRDRRHRSDAHPDGTKPSHALSHRDPGGSRLPARSSGGGC